MARHVLGYSAIERRAGKSLSPKRFAEKDAVLPLPLAAQPTGATSSQCGTNTRIGRAHDAGAGLQIAQRLGPVWVRHLAGL